MTTKMKSVAAKNTWKYIIIACLTLFLLTFIIYNTKVYEVAQKQVPAPDIKEQQQTFPMNAMMDSDDDINTKDGYLLTIFVRMYSGTLEWYSKYLLFSLELFWPSLLWKSYNTEYGYNEKTKLLIVLDDESFLDHSIASFINSSFYDSSLSPYFDLFIVFEAEPNVSSSSYINYGHDRQQWSMFYGDKYMASNDEYIAFVDTDTVFQTVVFPSDLFKDINHPIIFGRSKQSEWEIANEIAENTVQWLNIDREPFRCMDYFPVIIHQKHLLLMRKTIQNTHKKPFNQILYSLGRDPWSQFNVFCSFLWNYKRSQYKFVIERMGVFNDSMDYFESNIIPAQKVISFDEIYNEHKDNDNDLISFEPHIRVSNHAKYMAKKWRNESKNAVLYGYCAAVQFEDNDYCNSLNINKESIFLTKNISINNDINPYLFYFEYQYNFLFHPNVESVYKTHYSKLAKYAANYNHSWNKESLNTFVNEANNNQNDNYYRNPHRFDHLQGRSVDGSITRSSYIPSYLDGSTNNERQTIWHQSMGTDILDKLEADDDWIITALTEYKEGANAGSESDCPETGKENNPCWAICNGYVEYIGASTLQYNDIELTFSIDPWAMTNTDEYCVIEWSTDDGDTWNQIGEHYTSDHEIIGKTVHLGDIAQDEETLYLRIYAHGGTDSNCCYLAEFYLSGIPTQENGDGDGGDAVFDDQSGADINYCYYSVVYIFVFVVLFA